MEKRFLIEKELDTWAKEDRSLAFTVKNIGNMLSRLSGEQSKKTTSRSKRKNEPIVLDGADDQPKKLKPNEMIEIDIESDDENDKKPSATSGADDFVDLTWFYTTRNIT